MITRRKFFSFFGAGVVMAAAPKLLFPTRPYWTKIGTAMPWCDASILHAGCEGAVLAVDNFPGTIQAATVQQMKVEVLAALGLDRVKWDPLKMINGAPVFIGGNAELKVGDRIVGGVDDWCSRA